MPAAEKGARRGKDPDLVVGAPLEVVVDLHRASVVRLTRGACRVRPCFEPGRDPRKDRNVFSFFPFKRGEGFVGFPPSILTLGMPGSRKDRAPLGDAASAANAELGFVALPPVRHGVPGTASASQRRTEKQKHGRATQSGGTPLQQSTDTFTLSPDTSPVCMVGPDIVRSEPIAVSQGVAAKPMLQRPAATPPPQRLLAPERASRAYVAEFDDSGAVTAPPPSWIRTPVRGKAELDPTGLPGESHAEWLDDQLVRQAELKLVEADRKLADAVSELQKFDTVTSVCDVLDESADLDAEEEAHYLQLLQRKKAAKAHERAQQIKQVAGQNHRKPQISGNHKKPATHAASEPPPDTCREKTKTVSDSETEDANVRKFRVLPSVAASSSPQSTSKTPRILEVRKFADRSSTHTTTSNVPELSESKHDLSMSPFTAFIRDAAVAAQTQIGNLSHVSKVERPELPKVGELMKASSIAGDELNQDIKSVHFAPTVISSRELSFAPKAQRVSVGTGVGPMLDTVKIFHSHHACQDTAANGDGKESGTNVAVPEAYGHSARESPLDESTLACSPNASIRAQSWSGVGFKLQRILDTSNAQKRAGLVGLAGGLEVVQMEVGGPAESAGIEVGDVIMSLSNGVLSKGTSAMEATTRLRQQSGAYHIIVSRRSRLPQGWERKLTAIVMQPASITDAALDTDIGSGFTLRDGRGGPEFWSCLPIVANLIDGSSAHRSGLRIGDVLIAVGSLQMASIPGRAAISLLHGESGTQLLLGVYRRSAIAKGADPCSLQWVFVARKSGSQVRLLTTSPQAPAPQPQNDIVPMDDVASSALSNQGPGLMLSPMAADASGDSTYFAYRETADNSAAVSPDPPTPPDSALSCHADESLVALREYIVRQREHRRASAELNAGEPVGDDADKSLQLLQKQARAREKRQAFISRQDWRSGPDSQVMRSEDSLAENENHTDTKRLTAQKEAALDKEVLKSKPRSSVSKDGRFAMMRVMMQDTSQDDSLLEFVRKADDAQRLRAHPSTGPVPEKIQQNMPENSEPVDEDVYWGEKVCKGVEGTHRHMVVHGLDCGQGRLAGQVEKQRTQENTIATLQTPPKPSQPHSVNIRFMEKADVEREAWKYVRQYQIRSELIAERSRTAGVDAQCVAKATGVSLGLAHQALIHAGNDVVEAILNVRSSSIS